MCGSVLGYRGIEEIATKSVYQGEWLVGRMAENTRKVEGMTSWGDAKERIKAREIQVKVPGKPSIPSTQMNSNMWCGHLCLHPGRQK